MQKGNLPKVLKLANHICNMKLTYKDFKIATDEEFEGVWFVDMKHNNCREAFFSLCDAKAYIDIVTFDPIQ